MRQYRTHPDLTIPVLSYFETNLAGAYVAADLTGWNAPEKWVTIQSSGGSILNFRTGEARFDVNAYAPSKPEAKALALSAINTFMEMLNYQHTDGTVITEITCTYPSDISDPINSNPRFVFDATVSYRTGN